MLSHNLCGVAHEGPGQVAFIVIKIKHRSTGYTVLLPHVLGVGGAQLRLSPPAASRHTAQLTTSSVTGAKKSQKIGQQVLLKNPRSLSWSLGYVMRYWLRAWCISFFLFFLR